MALISYFLLNPCLNLIKQLKIVSIAKIRMDCRLRNVPNSKRIFGKDITNLDKRNKNNSILDKPALHLDNRPKSYSFDKKSIIELRDPISEYESQIICHMMHMERRQQKELTTHVTSSMRQILIDWLVDVHQSFQLKEQTLYLAFAYLNEYCSLADISKHEYQLVGITCLWIASKYEEIYPPRMQNYIQVTDSSYSLNQLKSTEDKILLALNFNLTFTTPLQILEAVGNSWKKQPNGKMPNQLKRSLSMGKYLIELSILEGISKDFCLKTIVLSAFMLSDSLLKVKTNTDIIEKDKVEKETLMRCFKEMCMALQNVSKPNLKFRAVKKKYSDQKYMGVSKFRIQQK